MSTELESATVSYKQVCDKNGFCVIKIVPQTITTPISKLEENPEDKIKETEQADKDSKAPIKFSSSRKKKKK
jgi:hypothetical protein